MQKLPKELKVKQQLRGFVEEEKQTFSEITSHQYMKDFEAENQAKHILGEEEIN